MTAYCVTWSPTAQRKMRQYHKEDPQGVDQILDSVNALASNPRPRGAWGSGSTLRIHVGRYRVWYEINDTAVTITIFEVGRT